MKLSLAGLFLIAVAAHAQTPEERLVQTSLPKVVTIEVTGYTDGYETDESTQIIKKEVGYIGAGAIIRPDGLILTCDHLFEKKLTDRLITVKSVDGHKYRALLLDEDSKHDLGLLKIFPFQLLPAFEVGASVRRGQQVAAFGAPLGLEKTVSFGYIENLLTDGEHMTVHSASINPGNSGGPLVDMYGRLVGVNVSYLLINAMQRAEGLGQAVRLHDIRAFLKD